MARSSLWSRIEEVREACETSDCIQDVLHKLAAGSSTGGGNYGTLRMVCQAHEIKVPVWTGGNRLRRVPLEQVMIEGSTYSRGHLKVRLIEEGLLEERCLKCGLGPEWQGERLALHLDHENGVGNDNRFENLRLLCPNCHSQTDTFAGRNIGRAQEQMVS